MRINRKQLRRIIKEAISDPGAWSEFVDAIEAIADEEDLMYALEAGPVPELADMVVTGPDDWGLRRTRQQMQRAMRDVDPSVDWRRGDADQLRLRVLRLVIDRLDELVD